MNKLLMLGTGMASKEIIEYAKSQGIYTILTDLSEVSKSEAKQLADEHWDISTADLHILEEKCREENVNGIICGVSEFNLEMTMELCERLNLPSFCTPEAWHYSRDKAEFKKLCNRIGAPVATDYFLSDDLTDEELSKVQYPVVVKPVDLSGNRGITYCQNKAELVEAYRYARSLSKNPKIVVERMLHGKEWYGYYALANGESSQIALIAMEAEPGQLKNLYSLSTTVTDDVERYMTEINPVIKKVLKEVGCKEGIAWVQVMLDEDDHFYIIEMGYRLPGDVPFFTFPNVMGFDSVKWLVDYSMGKKYTCEDLPKEQVSAYKKCGTGYSLWTHKAGKIKEFKGFDEILKIPGVDFHTLYHVGDSFVLHRPLGVISVSADNIDEFCSKIEQINKTISIIDEEDEDVIIRYTDFNYLKETYNRGINA